MTPSETSRNSNISEAPINGHIPRDDRRNLIWHTAFRVALGYVAGRQSMGDENYSLNDSFIYAYAHNSVRRHDEDHTSFPMYVEDAYKLFQRAQLPV